MNRAFLSLSVLLLLLVALIIVWAQTGQEQGTAVVLIKQSTIALLLLLAFTTVLWLLKSLLDSSISFNERESSTSNEKESSTMRVREDKDSNVDPVLAAGKLASLVSAQSAGSASAIDEPIDTQAEIDRIRALIADDPEKVAMIVKRWIGPGE